MRALIQRNCPACQSTIPQAEVQQLNFVGFNIRGCRIVDVGSDSGVRINFGSHHCFKLADHIQFFEFPISSREDGERSQR